MHFMQELEGKLCGIQFRLLIQVCLHCIKAFRSARSGNKDI